MTLAAAFAPLNHTPNMAENQSSHRDNRRMCEPCPTGTVDTSERGSALTVEIENLTDAIASGGLKSSPALAKRLAKTERELEQLLAQKPALEVAKMIPAIADEYRAWVQELETILSPSGLKRGLVSDRDTARTRAQPKKRLGGHIIVTETENEIRFETEGSAKEIALRLAQVGGQEILVAGAGWPSPLRGSVMSAGCAGLGMNLLRRTQPCLGSENKNGPRKGAHLLFW